MFTHISQLRSFSRHVKFVVSVGKHEQAPADDVRAKYPVQRFAWKLCHVAPSLSKSTFFKPLSETCLEQIISI